MTTTTHLNNEVEALRAELDAPLEESAEQLLERASRRAGREVFTVPQARAALAQAAEIEGDARPRTPAALTTQPSQGGAKAALLGLRWQVLPWAGAREELPYGVASLLEKCGHTLFRTKAEPLLYLVADYDPDVARLLALGSPDIKVAALRGVRNLLDEAGHAEWELEEDLKRLGAMPSGSGHHVD